MTGTTHNGGGRPKLIAVLGGDVLVADPNEPFTIQASEIELTLAVNVIGSGPESEIRLPGLETRHAELRRDDRDEWVLKNLALQEPTQVNGKPIGEQALHTGDRVDIGTYTFSFFRDEDADHGRPFGGRQGGELSDQQPQPSRDQQGPATRA